MAGGGAGGGVGILRQGFQVTGTGPGLTYPACRGGKLKGTFLTEGLTPAWVDTPNGGRNPGRSSSL